MRKTIYKTRIQSGGMIHDVEGELDQVINNPEVLKAVIKDKYYWMFEDIVEGERVFTVEGEVFDTPKWNVGHFPRGTVCEVYVCSIADMPKRITVTDIHRNGPDSYVLVSNEWNETCRTFHSYNIDHVCRIISRGTGTTKLTEHNKERYEKQFFEELRRENFRANGINKQRNQYQTFSVRELALFVARKYMNDDMILDMDKMIDLLFKRGVLIGKSFFSNEGEDRIWDLKYFDPRKKKLNRAIKQLLNKCLCNHAKAQKEENKMYSDIAEKDMFDDLDRELVEEATARAGEGSSYDGVNQRGGWDEEDVELEALLDDNVEMARAALGNSDSHPLDGPLNDNPEEYLKE